MKKALLFVVSALWLCFANGQGGTWVWVKGSNTVNANAVYGTQGVASDSNTPQGLYAAANWIDLQGNFWIFGGNVDLTSTGTNSDLWKYEPATNMWTWVNGPGVPSAAGVYGTMGVPAPGNYPASRGWEALSWTDNNNNLWLFGGGGNSASGVYGDLWRYSISTNEWTWMGGDGTDPVYGVMLQPADSNYPGGRWEDNSSWTDDNNNLWFFGGPTNGDHCNDMWQYNISANQWTWMKGPQLEGEIAGHYGTLGVEDTANLPPGRWTYTDWKDPCGNFYIWAGMGSAPGGGPDPSLGDVWKFNPVTNNWTWIAGYNSEGDPTDTSDHICHGVYNNYCLNSGTIGPMCRSENKSPKAIGGTSAFYAFGGMQDYMWRGMNDLWIFYPQTSEWKWLSGADTLQSPGNYGSAGVAAVTNVPPARGGSCMWLDASGGLWVFGGADNWDSEGMHNDIWKFIPDTACTGSVTIVTNYQLSASAVCPGDSVLFSLLGDSAIQLSPSADVSWIDTAHAWIKPDSTTTYLITGGYSSCTNTQSFTITVVQGSVSITAGNTTLCPGDSATLCAPGGLGSYHWSTGETTTCIHTANAGAYTVTVSQNGQCSATSNQITISNYTPVPVTISVSGDTLTCPDAGPYQWLLNGTVITGATTSTYIAQTAGSYTVQITDVNGCNAISSPVLITGLNELTESSISVYPNPTNSNWQITVHQNLIGAEYEIFDVTGRVVVKSTIRSQQSAIEINAASGVYLLRIVSGGAEYAVKLVKF